MNKHNIEYHNIRIEDIDVFYRESGPKEAPVVFLLHGFPWFWL